MEKLELKHLAPYLPYGLQCHAMGMHTAETEYDDNPVPLLFTITGTFTDSSKNRYVEAFDLEGDQHEIFFDTDFFPILRPLSDLHKLIDESEPDVTYYNWMDAEFNVDVPKYGYDFSYQGFGIDTCQLPYEAIEYLLEHHFDVFGLIPFDLAIDINTLR